MARKLLIVALLAALLSACAGGNPHPVPVITSAANLPDLEPEAFRGAKTLAELLGISEDTDLVLYTEDGAITPVTGSARMVVRGGRLLAEGGHPIRGIVLDPPELINTEAYSWAHGKVQAGNRALVIVIDGMGYEYYTWATEQGLAPNLARGQVREALTVFTPVTNAGMAAILTGVTPDKSGIHHRGHRQPQVTDILGSLKDLGMSGVVIEGDINILDLQGEVILNLDTNGDGTSDDEIQATALTQAGLDWDYMLVHYHSLDDAGHSFGPWSEEANGRMAILDQYVGALLSVWPGPVLVVADHGMHETNEGGRHGQFRYEDMFVPIIYFSQEEGNNED